MSDDETWATCDSCGDEYLSEFVQDGECPECRGE